MIEGVNLEHEAFDAFAVIPFVVANEPESEAEAYVVEKIEPVSADLVIELILKMFAAYVVQLLSNVTENLGSETAYWRQEWWTLVSVIGVVIAMKIAAAFQIHCSEAFAAADVMKCSADLSFVVVAACLSDHFAGWTAFDVDEVAAAEDLRYYCVAQVADSVGYPLFVADEMATHLTAGKLMLAAA